MAYADSSGRGGGPMNLQLDLILVSTQKMKDQKLESSKGRAFGAQLRKGPDAPQISV